MSSRPSSSKMSSSSVHPASLVDASLHSPALLELVELKLSRQVMEYVVHCVVETVDYAMGRPVQPRGRSAVRRPEHDKFATFVSNVLTRAEVTTPTVLAALVYIDRSKPHLHIALEEWALERVFLGALIVAAKYLNDSTLKNVHWALCTGVFGKRDVGRIEREFLDVLDFELSVTEADLLSHHAGLSSAVHSLSRSHHNVSTVEYSHSHTHTRRHSTRHHQRSYAVPDLAPSSPESSESSDGTSSPQTPSPISASPMTGIKPTHTDAPNTKKSYHDLLRSFPIPINHSHHSQFIHHGSEQFPIQVDV